MPVTLGSAPSLSSPRLGLAIEVDGRPWGRSRDTHPDLLTLALNRVAGEGRSGDWSLRPGAQGLEVRGAQGIMDGVISPDLVKGRFTFTHPPDQPPHDVPYCLRMALSYILPLHGVLLFHGASAVLNGRGVLFVGPSEAGKSTMAGLMEQAIADGKATGMVLADEYSAVGRGKGGWLMEDLNLRGPQRELSPGAPLAGIYLLSQAPSDRVEPVSTRDAMAGLVGTILVADPSGLAAQACLSLVSALVEAHRVRRLCFTPTWGAVRAVLESL